MSEQQLDQMKNALLSHVQSIFDDAEEALSMQHQEKYALLEDACENATDVDELRVAFEQWYRDHSEDLEIEQEPEEVWDSASALAEEFGDEFDEEV